ncbi:unnamed protein product [Paramecium octaurelia]|uniref:Cryptochrome/photolyase family protein n=1 Tax=Paramecium octaurelia TaxID=43137 RepID=A0A8S1XF56_PAROT|nr:unnamed protein product [Paramecium octaurelia]
MTTINDIKHQKQEKLRLSLRKERNENTFSQKRQISSVESKAKIFLLFPVNLYKNIDILKNYNKIFLIEDDQYFRAYNYHKLKLVYHRASMKSYQDYLMNNLKDATIHYIEQNENCSAFLESLQSTDKIVIAQCDFYDPIDKPVLQKYSNILQKLGIQSEIKENLSYLCTRNDLQQYHKEHVKLKDGKPNYSHDSSFYRWQRRRLNILMGPKGEDPEKWTYDSENRQPLKPGAKVPKKPDLIKSSYYDEAISYVTKHFPKNFGEIKNTIYPIDHDSTEEWLDCFLKQKLSEFGPYQDAVHSDYPFVNHSILSPMMNIGLITSSLIVDKTLQYYKQNKAPIQSVEGFLRQVIGWREYVRLLYFFEGEQQMKANFFNHQNELSNNWYTGQTKLPPIDHMIQKVIKYAYLHHIERLMYIGNTMLLSEINPKQVFKWFMEVHIDSYEWVMAPNVFGMTQHADGGIMMTRPYICSSNYMQKMSNFNKSTKSEIKIEKQIYNWPELFDSLYYNFIGKNEGVLKQYYATARQVAHWTKKSEMDKIKITKIASTFIKQLIK